jgi:hypothetical protein
MADLDQLVLLDEEELFARLGEATGPRGFGPKDAEAYARLGRAWFHQQSQRVRSAICSDRAVRALVDGGAEYDALLQAATVATAVAGVFDQHVTPVFAVLVAKTGLTFYCDPRRS